MPWLMADTPSATERLKRMWALDATIGIEQEPGHFFLQQIISNRYALVKGTQLIQDELMLAFNSPSYHSEAEHLHVGDVSECAADLSKPSVLTTCGYTMCGDRICQSNALRNYLSMVAGRFGSITESGEAKPELFFATGGGTDSGPTLAHVTVGHSLDPAIKARLYGGHAGSIFMVNIDVCTHCGHLDIGENNSAEFLGRRYEGVGAIYGLAQESIFRDPRPTCGAIVGMLTNFNLNNSVHVRLRHDLGEANWNYLSKTEVLADDGSPVKFLIAAAIIAIQGMRNTLEALGPGGELDGRGLGHMTAQVQVNNLENRECILYCARATVFDGTITEQGLGTDATKYSAVMQTRENGEKHVKFLYDGRDVFPITTRQYEVAGPAPLPSPTATQRTKALPGGGSGSFSRSKMRFRGPSALAPVTAPASPPGGSAPGSPSAEEGESSRCNGGSGAGSPVEGVPGVGKGASALSASVGERVQRMWGMEAAMGVEEEPTLLYLQQIIANRFALVRGRQLIKDELMLAFNSPSYQREEAGALHIGDVSECAADLSLPSVLTTCGYTMCGDRICQSNALRNYLSMVAGRFGSMTESGQAKPELFFATGGGTDSGPTLAHVTVGHSLDPAIKARLYGGHAGSIFMVNIDVCTHCGHLDIGENNSAEFLGRRYEGVGAIYGLAQESIFRDPRPTCGAIVGMLTNFNLNNSVHVRLRHDLGEANWNYLSKTEVLADDGSPVKFLIAAAIIAIQGMRNTLEALGPGGELDGRGLGHMTAQVQVNNLENRECILYCARATVFDGTITEQGLGTDATKYSAVMQTRENGEKHVKFLYDGRDVFPITTRQYEWLTWKQMAATAAARIGDAEEAVDVQLQKKQAVRGEEAALLQPEAAPSAEELWGLDQQLPQTNAGGAEEASCACCSSGSGGAELGAGIAAMTVGRDTHATQQLPRPAKDGGKVYAY